MDQFVVSVLKGTAVATNEQSNYSLIKDLGRTLIENIKPILFIGSVVLIETIIVQSNINLSPIIRLIIFMYDSLAVGNLVNENIKMIVEILSSIRNAVGDNTSKGNMETEISSIAATLRLGIQNGNVSREDTQELIEKLEKFEKPSR